MANLTNLGAGRQLISSQLNDKKNSNLIKLNDPRSTNTGKNIYSPKTIFTKQNKS